MAVHLLGVVAPKPPPRLVKIGGKLAVLGVDRQNPRLWHFLRPGSWDAPQTQSNETLAHGKALCGKLVESNGYASDFVPAEGSWCPACKAQL